MAQETEEEVVFAPDYFYNLLTAQEFAAKIDGVYLGWDENWLWFIGIYEPILLDKLDRGCRGHRNPLANHVGPEDLIQEVYARIRNWRTNQFGPDKATVLALLMKTLGWVYQNACRLRNTKARDPKREAGKAAEQPNLADHHRGPADTAAAADEMRRALAEVAEENRPIIDAYLDHKSIPKIAAELMLGVKWVRTVVSAFLSRWQRRAQAMA